MQDDKPPVGDLTILRWTLVAATGIGIAVLLWKLTDLILLLLAAMLVAFIFHKFAKTLQRLTHMPFGLALTLAVVLPFLFLVVVFAVFGNLMANEFAILFERLPDAWHEFRSWLAASEIGRQLTDRAGNFMPEGGRIVDLLQASISGIGSFATNLVVVLVGGVYLAAQPRLYGEGVLKLLPPPTRDKTARTVAAIGEAMSAWLKAQGLAMLFIGVFTGVALAIVGIPAAPAIGLVAGLCEFVPYLGSIVVVIPATLIGFSISPETGLWTLISILIVQNVQGNVVTPLIQSSMVELPPALTIFALIAAGLLFGGIGIILAVPLTVVGQTMLRELLHYRADDAADAAAADAAATAAADPPAANG